MATTRASGKHSEEASGGGGQPAAAITRERDWRARMLVGLGLSALLAILAVIVAAVAISRSGDGAAGAGRVSTAPASHPGAAAIAPAPTLAQAAGISYERFRPVDATLPPVPAGPIKRFTVSVIQHVVQVASDLAPVQAWNYTVDGSVYRGVSTSPPMVVDQGDRVQITFRNGTAADGVNMAHSIDVHAAELAPNLDFIDVAPGRQRTITFTARYPGVFMYHCASQPVLLHVGAGMSGMLVVKPHDLPPVAKELWVVQSEAYLGRPGGLPDMAKLQAESPDVIMFNGYADQYQYAPIDVPAGKPIRLYVLNSGPSRWSAFHVIGDVFDTVDEEGAVSHGAQIVNLAPAEGATVTFTLPQAGNYPFMTHSLGDMVKGAEGVLHTPAAPAVPPAMTTPPAGGSTGPVPAPMSADAVAAMTSR